MRCALLSACLLVAACASQASAPGRVAAPAAPPPAQTDMRTLATVQAPDAVGQINPRLLREIGQVRFIDHLKLVLAADGHVHELSVYHDDPEPIPQAVKQRVADELPGSRIGRYETEWILGRGQVFEVVVTTHDGRVCEVKALPDGTLWRLECFVRPEETPAAVRATAARVYPDGVVESIAYEEEGAQHVFVMRVRVGSVLHGLQISPDGVLSRHVEIFPTFMEVEVSPAPP